MAFDVKGMSIEDILRIKPEELDKMSRADLARVTTRLASAANKRIRRFSAAGVSSAPLREVNRSGGRISARGKSGEALRREYERARQFLSAPTGTVRGKKASDTAYYKQRTEELSESYGFTVSPSLLKKMEDVYEKMKDIFPQIRDREERYKFLEEAARFATDNGKSRVKLGELLDHMNGWLENRYEQSDSLPGSGVSGLIPGF